MFIIYGVSLATWIALLCTGRPTVQPILILNYSLFCVTIKGEEASTYVIVSAVLRPCQIGPTALPWDRGNLYK